MHYLEAEIASAKMFEHLKTTSIVPSGTIRAPYFDLALPSSLSRQLQKWNNQSSCGRVSTRTVHAPLCHYLCAAVEPESEAYLLQVPWLVHL